MVVGGVLLAGKALLSDSDEAGDAAGASNLSADTGFWSGRFWTHFAAFSGFTGLLLGGLGLVPGNTLVAFLSTAAGLAVGSVAKKFG